MCVCVREREGLEGCRLRCPPCQGVCLFWFFFLFCEFALLGARPRETPAFSMEIMMYIPPQRVDGSGWRAVAVAVARARESRGAGGRKGLLLNKGLR